MTERVKAGRASSVAAALLTALMAVTLAACVGIPTEGGVNAGDIVQDRGDFPFAPLPSGPQRDATQQEILTDFMQAATSPEGGYEIARQFLTTDAAGEWNPNKSVLIRENPEQLIARGATLIDYSTSTRASVTSQGLYSEDATEGTQLLSYGFEQVDGQWRISELPDGIVLSRGNFERVFAPHSIYFFDPTYRYLVPDLRWFPARSNIAQRIVSALLTGQAGWLQQGATISAFPEGTSFSSIEISSGIATVDLTAAVATASALDRARMLDQLARSFGAVTTVTGVQLTVEGAPLPLDAAQTSAAVYALTVDPDPLVRLGEQFGFGSRSGIVDLGTLGATLIELDASAVTLARGRSLAAALADDGVYLAADSDAPPLLVDSRPDLVAPSIDTLRYVWSVPADQPSAIHATTSDGVVIEVTSDLPGSGRVVSFDVSRDGTRVAMYLSTDAGPRLIVAAILRREGIPVALGELVDLPVTEDSPLDATWADGESIATLARSAAGEFVSVYQIGGPRDAIGIAQGAVQIVGGNSVEQLRVITDDGEILQRRASGWQGSGITADYLATQQ